MSNLSYNRSRAREQQLVREFRALGWYAARSAGSKSPWDIYTVLPKEGEVRLIQVKTKKGGRKLVRKLLSSYGQVEEWLYTWS